VVDINYKFDVIINYVARYGGATRAPKVLRASALSSTFSFCVVPVAPFVFMPV
jgi:hypothetical protein